MVDDDHRPSGWTLLAVALPQFLYAIDNSMVQIVLPRLAGELRADFATVQWVLLAYLLGLVTLLLGIGRLGDLYGRKPVLVAGLAAFGLGSLFCALAPNIVVLIAFRALQSVGAACIMVLVMALATGVWPERQRGRILGILAGTISLGSVIGPGVGGYLIAAYGWRAVFVVNIPLSLVAILLVTCHVPQQESDCALKAFDLWGAILLGGTWFALALALTLSQEHGLLQPGVLALLATSAGSLGLFIIVERNARSAILDLGLFQDSEFCLNLVNAVLIGIATSGVVFLLPFYLLLALGLGIDQVGFLMAAISFSLAILAPICGGLSDQFGTRRISNLGLLALILGFLSASTLGENTTGDQFVLRMLPLCLGIALFTSPNNSGVMSAAPKNQLGVVSSTLLITRTLGQITGLALLGAIFAARLDDYAGANVDLLSASPGLIVRSLQAQFHMVAAIAACAFVLRVGLGWWMRRHRQEAVWREQEI